ncbi:MAG: DHA2 family efflux MFS transporter permease subunit [Chthoniobacteraceae bacterium]
MSPIKAYSVRFGAGYRWYATVTVMFGTIVTTASSTMINVALPDIMGAFGLGSDQIQWLSTGFLAAMTATMLLTAWALNRLGYRLCFMGALGLFIAGSVIGALSRSGGEVILARVLQGLASGLIQPSAMVVMSHVFPRGQRGRAMGIYGIGVVLAPALGPALGGYLVDEYNWRDVFWALTPLSACGIAAAAVFLPGLGDERHRKVPHHFDGAGFALLSVFLVTLLSGLSDGQREGWNSDFIVTLFAVSLLAFGAFVARELTFHTPLLNLRVFANARFAASCVVSFALGVGIYGSTYIVPLFLQLVQGYTPTRSGLLLMPAGFVLALVFPCTGLLADLLPPWIPITVGLGIFGVSNWLCGGVDVDTPFWLFALWIVVGRIGLGMITPSLNAGALRALPHALLAQGSGTVNFVRQLGGALGVNLLSVIIDRRGAFHGAALAEAVTASTAAASETVRRLIPLVNHWGSPFGTRLPQGASPTASAYLESMLMPKARLLAYQDGFLVVALMFLISLAAGLLMRGRGAEAEPK